jgi:DNA invertase Pin-like site-specific DNA recombinase
VAPPLTGQLRFAFYGRVSTEDHQDPVSSRAWQRTRAEALIAGTGQIVVEFFDVGRSRVLPWAARPAAAALIAALADPDREFDAIVVGEAERAFYGPQYEQMAPIFAKHGVRIWVPDVGGPVDPAIGSLEELMALLGILSKREIVRARIRTMTSMTILTEKQGRFLGGRAPFGYRLVPIKPHPNPTHARWGRMQLGLAPDPTTAPIVEWMFAQRLAAISYARIARALNDAHIPPPSAADRERNRHRAGLAWSVTSVAAILTNPRYTGHEVWQRTRTDHELIDPANTTLGHRDQVRHNRPDQWIISTEIAHTPLVSTADFIAVQGMRARADAATHEYLLAGILICGVCGRRLESCFANDHPGYRCRHGRTSASISQNPRRLTYVREDRVLEHLAAMLIRLRLSEHTDDPARRPIPELAPPTASDAITFFRHNAITLTYNPNTKTLTANTPEQETIAI